MFKIEHHLHDLILGFYDLRVINILLYLSIFSYSEREFFFFFVEA